MPKSYAVPKVSIGMPVYNGGHLLVRAIEAIQSQTFSDFEIIVSDNASSDSTRETVLRMCETDHRIKYYGRSRNVGAIRNFNRVVEIASGKYFMWAAHDDALHPTYIESCYNMLEKDDSVVLCYSSTNFVNEMNEFVKNVKDAFRIDQDSPTKRYLTLISQLNWCNCFYGMMRLAALSDTKLYQGNIAAGDCVLLAELALKGKFVQLDDILFDRMISQRPQNIETFFKRMQTRQNPHQPYRVLTSTPFLDFLKAHIDVVKDSELSVGEKNDLVQATNSIILKRYGGHIRFELDRLIALVSNGIVRTYWNTTNGSAEDRYHDLDKSYIIDLLGKVNLAMWVVPQKEGLYLAKGILMVGMGRVHEGREALNVALAEDPENRLAKAYLSMLCGRSTLEAAG